MAIGVTEWVAFVGAAALVLIALQSQWSIADRLRELNQTLRDMEHLVRDGMVADDGSE